jgi:IS30 family transposase
MRDELAEVERKLNDYPKKRLGWKMPRMLFEGAKSLN